jgi:excisionase family DNA binding protein
MSALLTIQQAAERLGVSEDTFRAIVREGGIPRIRISERVVRYDPEDVAAYQAQQIVPWSKRKIEAAPPAAELRAMSGQIYFILSGAANVKIGFTTDTDEKLKNRIRHLQTGNPKPLKLFAQAPGTRADEKLLHRKFGHLRERAEWFVWAGDLRAYVEAVRKSGKLGDIE